MAKTQNHVQLVGYLGGDPILRKAANGRAFTRLRMATDYYRWLPDGSVMKKATWHTIMAWSHVAESIQETFIKGSHVMIQGSICNRSFVGSDGIKKFFSHVEATTVVDLDR